RLRVGDEDDAVGALQHQLAARVVEDLTRHRVDVEAHLEAAHGAEVDRQEVEEERALGLRREADHLAARLLLRLSEDPLEVGRLPAEPRTVIDDLAVELLGHVVDVAHRFASTSLASAVTRARTRAASIETYEPSATSAS